jgi:hypothetical protein
MLFEPRLAYSRLRPGGLLIADDIEWNDAFDIFHRESCHSNDRMIVVNRGYADMGIIAKAMSEAQPHFAGTNLDSPKRG